MNYITESIAKGEKLQLKTMEKILRQISVFLALMSLHSRTSHSALKSYPLDTEVLLNHSTYFNCSTLILSEQIHWYHYRAGEDQINYVYYKGQINANYADRYSIEVNIEAGKYNLIIRLVQPGDAGRYVCQDDGGLGGQSSAELIVLDSAPACVSSMETDGLVGPNSCGLPIEELHLSCNVSYNGNIPPVLQWKMEGEDTPISKGIAIDNAGRSVMMNLTMSSEVKMNGALFTCGTTRSHHKQHSCTTNPVKINYAVGEPMNLYITKGESVTCSVKASVPCQYRWYTEFITTTDLMDYSCEANCTMNGLSCIFTAMRIFVIETETSTASEDTNKNALLIVIVILITTVVFLLVTTCVLLFRIRKGNKRAGAKQKLVNTEALSQEETEQMLRATNDYTTKIQALENEQECKRPEAQALGDQMQKLPDETSKLGEKDKDKASDSKISQMVPDVKDAGNDEGTLRKEGEAIELQHLRMENPVNMEADEGSDEGVRPKGNLPANNGIEIERSNVDDTELAHPCIKEAEIIRFSHGGETITKASKEMGRAIAGVAILEDLIYVVSDKSYVVETFALETLECKTPYKLEGLEDPWDLASCRLNNCLYIMDRCSLTKPKRVTRVDSYVNDLVKWSTGEEYGSLSVTSDGRVVVTLCDSSRLFIYEPDGTRMKVVILSKDFIHPSHAIELSYGQFLISHGLNEDNLQRVCIINASLELVKNSFDRMETPSYLAVSKTGLVFVADQGNSRGCTLNSDLELMGELASKYGLRSPQRICLDEKTRKLLVVDNEILDFKRRNGKLLSFNYDVLSG